MCFFVSACSSCGKGEKKNEPVRVKVAEAAFMFPSAEREFSFIAKAIQGDRTLFSGGRTD